MSDWIEHVTPPSPCPSCGRISDRASNVEGEGVPEPGDLLVCIRCGDVLLFDDRLGRRRPTDAEMFQLMMSESWPKIARMRRAVLLAIHMEDMKKEGGDR